MYERLCMSFILGAAFLSTGAFAFVQDSTASAVAKGSAPNEASAQGQKDSEKASSIITSTSALNASAVAENSAEVKRNLAELKSGTTISTELEQAVDARTAKPGDLVSAKVTKDVKREGRTVIKKGDQLLGRITSVNASTTGQAGSELGVAFDRLMRGDAEYQLNTVVSSVISSSADMGAKNDIMALDEPMMTRAPATSAGGRAGVGGGLVGGATSTVGSAVSATGSAAGGLTSAVGGTANSTIGAAGNTAGISEHGSAQSGTRLGLATPVRDIRLHSQTDASQSGGTTSMLGARRGNLRLESGTQMKFKVSNQTSAEMSKK